MRVTKALLALVLISTTLTSCDEEKVFSDKPIAGKINGKNWEFHHVSRSIYDFGTKKVEKVSLVTEACIDEYCNEIKTPRITLNLDAAKPNGEFTLSSNVTIFTPPNTNRVVSNGKYKFFQKEGNEYLSLKFHIDEKNYLDGTLKYN